MLLAGLSLTLALLGPPTGVEALTPAETAEAPQASTPAPEDPPSPSAAAPDAETAAPTPSERPEPRPDPELPDIRFRLAVDLPILLGFTAVFGVTEGLKPLIAPDPCRWCQPGPVARAVRRGLVWEDTESAALSSDIIGYGVIPAFGLTMTLIAVGTQGKWRKVHEDLIVALEAVAVSGGLTNAIKFSTGRQRPYALFAAAPIPFDEDPDQNLSFPSGHTSLAFSMATGFATVATLRDRKLAPVMWGIGVPAAAFVGYLRMAGDRHWFGDVLAGAGLGTLAGVGLPWLLHHPRTGVIPRLQRRGARVELQVLPTAGGVMLAGRV